MKEVYKRLVGHLPTETICSLIIRDIFKDKYQNTFDESFVLDLNPHLEVNKMLDDICDLVFNEDMICSKDEVALLLLTDCLILLNKKV